MTVREMQVLFENLIGQYSKEVADRLLTDQIEIYLNHAQTIITNREFVELSLDSNRQNINNKLAKFRNLTKVKKGIVETKQITHGAVTVVAAFLVGDTVTGGTSGATAKVIEVLSGSIIVSPISGTIANGEVITGTSTAVATTTAAPVSYNYTSIPANNSNFYSLVNITDYAYYMFGTCSNTRTDKTEVAFTATCELINIEKVKDYIINDFNKPYIRSPKVALLENGIVLVHDPESTVTTLDITYLRLPKKMTSFTLSGVYANYVNTCELPEEMHREVVEIAVKSAISTNNPQLYQIKQQESIESDT